MHGIKSCLSLSLTRSTARVMLARYYASYPSPGNKPIPPDPHIHLDSDLDNLLSSLRSSPARTERRESIRRTLDGLIQSVDSNFCVQSVGMEQYGPDLNIHPHEFAIVAKTPMDPEVWDNRDMSPVHRADKVLNTLKRKYQRVVLDRNPQDSRIPHTEQTLLPIHEYPLSLHIKDFKTTAKLSLPSPFTPLRVGMLQEIYENDQHKELLGLVSAWTTSIQVPNLTPTALALMTGCFLQDQDRYSLLRELFLRWLRFTHRIGLKRLQAMLISSKKPHYHTRKNSEKENLALWSDHPFGIQDPFVPTKNHVDKIGHEDWKKFIFLSGVAYKGLSRGHVLARLLGTGLKPSNIHPNYPITQPSTWGKAIMQFDPYKLEQPKDLTPTQIKDKKPESSKPSVGPTDPDEAFLSDLLKPSPEMDAKVQKTLENVNKAVQSKYHWTTVKLFGSTVYGTSSPTSDLDMMIYDPKLPRGHPGKFIGPDHPLYRLPNLRTLLIEKGFTDVKMVQAATVPIVMFRDPETGIRCDININARLGLYNTSLIADYCDVFPPLRSMLKFLKAWAKPLGLNCPAPTAGEPASFSSYALTLMTISFLQRRNILPNFQDGLKPILPEGRDRRHPRMIGKEPNATFWCRKPRILCDTRWNKRPLSAQNIPSTRQLIADWFRYYAQEFNYEGDEITFHPKESVGNVFGDFNDAHKRHIKQYFRIQDPFITDKNVVKHVGIKVLKHFDKECRRALERLEAGDGLASLIAPAGENPLQDPTKVRKLTRKKRAKLAAKSRFKAPEATGA